MHLLFICDPPVRAGAYNTGASQVILQYMRHLPTLGHRGTILTKEVFDEVPAGMKPYDYVCQKLDGIDFDAIHLATEGHLGFLVRRYCVARGLRFTSAYHGQYPEFLQSRLGIDPAGPYEILRWFHNRADAVLVPTPSMTRRLEEHGFKHAVPCMHGVDTDLFSPSEDRDFLNLPRPIWAYIGRLDPEKTVEDFLSLDLPGTKLVVGDGSVRKQLEEQFPDAVFVGLKLGKELAAHFSAADVFVFPSRTDTFGLVNMEALACGTPVAAYPVTGPIDIVTDPKIGCLDEDLRKACLAALPLSRQDCRDFAVRHSWFESAKNFMSHQVPARSASRNACPHSHAENARMRFELRYGPRLEELDALIADTENRLFGAKAHDLKPA